jgi:hypothetical protein
MCYLDLKLYNNTCNDDFKSNRSHCAFRNKVPHSGLMFTITLIIGNASVILRLHTSFLSQRSLLILQVANLSHQRMRWPLAGNGVSKGLGVWTCGVDLFKRSGSLVVGQKV